MAVTNNAAYHQQEIIETQRRRIHELENKLQAQPQQRIIDGLEAEVQWYRDLIFNPSFNEVDMRIIVNRTPPEMRMGHVSEVPERKIFLPAESEQVHASPKTITKRIKMLEQAGAVAYRTAPDPETGHARSYLQVLPALEQPSQITVDRAQRGGSTWQDGKRMKRCKDCGSEHLIEVMKRDVICDECGALQAPTRETRKPVNGIDPAPYSQDDCGPPEQDIDLEQEQENETPHSQDDCETPQDDECQTASTEIPKLPRITVSTVGIPTELRDLKQWVCWRLEENENKPKPDKMPYSPWGRSPQRAESNDPKTWGTLEQAQSMYERSQKEGWARKFDGIGIMFGNGVCGTDLDHCINSEGEMTKQADEVMTTIHSYRPVSAILTEKYDVPYN